MRLTPEQVRERFEREVKPDVCHCDQHGSRHVVPVEMAIAFAQLVARDLQARVELPTCEEWLAARCRVKNCLTAVINGGGYQADTALAKALEDLEFVCVAAGRAEASRAVDVLRRLEAAASKCVRVKLTVIVGHVSGQAIVEADTDCGEPYVHAEGETLLDAIASAMDQLAAGAAKGRP